MEKFQTINLLSGIILDEFTYSTYNKRTVISKYSFADLNDVIDLELSPLGTCLLYTSDAADE